MKATKFSLWLNLILLGVLAFLLSNRHAEKTASSPVISKAKPLAPANDFMPLPPTKAEPQLFQWQQLESKTDYRAYVANLRAIGCPEATIEDIVRGDTDRAFSWERSQLNLDGSGTGPWSQFREEQLVASLLRQAAASDPAQNSTFQTPAGATAMTMPASGTAPTTGENSKQQGDITEGNQPQVADTAPRAYPLFLQNVNWSALGFTADQQATIEQVRQQFQNNMAVNQNAGESESQTSSGNSSADNSTSLNQWQGAVEEADNQLRDELGSQAYAAYEQQQYYAWYQPQVMSHVGEGPLFINPDAFSMK